MKEIFKIIVLFVNQMERERERDKKRVGKTGFVNKRDTVDA